MNDLAGVLTAFYNATQCEAGVWMQSGTSEANAVREAATKGAPIPERLPSPSEGEQTVSSANGEILIAAVPGPRRAWLALGPCAKPGVELSVLNTTGTPQPRIQLFWNRQTHVAMVHAFNLTPAQSGRVYQLWFIQDGRPIPSVTFNSEPSGHAMVEHVPMPAGELTHAAVTLEPPGGSQAPTSPVMLIGSLES